ncbi:MAG: lysylphosphatidylglycerol synthase domain-containing protein, partial [Anaerolineae bacterium]
MTATNAVRPPATRWYRNWRFWLGGTVSLALVAWAIWSLDWRQVWRVLRSAHVGWIALAIATVLLTIGARVLRWRGLLLPQSFDLATLLTALLMGQVVNYVVLSQLGVLVRAAALGQGNRARALGTVALEKLWDVVMLLGLVAALSFGSTLPDWLTLPA